MKTCKDFNMEPCNTCRNGHGNREYPAGCWIDWYNNHIQDVIKAGRIKPYLVECIVSGRRIALLSVAIKEFYPEYNEWFQKMLLLV
jgi:hypothetical protein